MKTRRFLIGISCMLMISAFHLRTATAQTDAQPAATENAPSGEAKSVEATPAEIKAPEAKPSEATEAEPRTSEAKPGDVKPSETAADKGSTEKPVDGKPFDNKSPVKTVPPAHAGGADDGEYEIDYEEEPGSEGDEPEEEAPVKQKSNPRKKISSASPGGGAGGIQGSRAKHRFTPILKSETKSVYKKDGKALDVDSD